MKLQETRDSNNKKIIQYTRASDKQHLQTICYRGERERERQRDKEREREKGREGGREGEVERDRETETERDSTCVRVLCHCLQTLLQLQLITDSY